ncbi:hypothetical protein PR202_ga17987 [Eleusine coracana subsp. coracana]|uniref:30S ribosomal protein S15, chloroplastic n=1 Tax=Eleusine coracana subsp. coracana TaxID=191504 RepID=A0AAV5CRZ9_ELECO|nr:hypothetical protein PR202_ga17987 [Eleusine coracana subsp. coracana]
MAALLRARPNHNPLLPRPFSSSTSPPAPSPFPSPPSTAADPASPSLFADIHNRLGSTPVSASSSSPRRAAPSLVHDLRHTLKTFRNSNPTTNSSSTTPSFLDILANTKHSSAPAPPSSSSPFPFGALRDSLRKPGSAVPGAKTLDWSSLLSKPQRPPATAVLGRDPKEKAGAKSGLGFQRHYSYDELGKRLHALRPTGAGKDGKEESMLTSSNIDKHSRKGLQEMVQRRKKYLKYLRRTDWDSYCLVLSKLGLRDVPEFKPPDYKSKSSSKTKSKKKIKRKMKV